MCESDVFEFTQISLRIRRAHGFQRKKTIDRVVEIAAEIFRKLGIDLCIDAMWPIGIGNETGAGGDGNQAAYMVGMIQRALLRDQAAQ